MSNRSKAYEGRSPFVNTLPKHLTEQRPKDLHTLNKLRKQDVAIYAGSFNRIKELRKW